MDELRATWARRLREIRTRQGLTQEQVAALIGVRQRMLSAYELGIHVPRDDVRIALAAALGVRVRDLFPYPDDDESGAAA